MSNVTAQFLFDFGSPNAYRCYEVLPQITFRTGVAFESVLILLGGLFKLTNNRSPAEAFAGIAHKRAYDTLEVQRFLAKHQLSKFRMNPFFPVNTLMIMRGAVTAQKLGCFENYVDVVYSCRWERNLNMADVEVAGKALATAGLDAKAILSLTQDAKVKERLGANTQETFERGAFGSPTFFVGKEIYFGKNRLREVEEDIVAQLGR